MIPPPHRLSEEDFVALARSGGGPAVIRQLAKARRSRTLQLIRFAVSMSDSPVTRRAYQVLTLIHKLAPEATGRVLDYPSVGAWVTRTGRQLSTGDSAATEELACVALAAAVRAGISVSLPMPERGSIRLPSLGTVHTAVRGEIAVHRHAAGVDIANARIPADPGTAGPGWEPLPRIAVRGGTRRAAFVLDPWAGARLPPNVAVARAVDQRIWQERIGAGWDLLVRHHPAVAEELAAAITVLTPLRTPQEGISSATVADAFGCLFLSLPPDAATAAVTLAHELQHTKLIALMDLFSLLVPDTSETFYAPWRNDPRPLIGLLHGTYAYLGVTAFWRRQRTVVFSPPARTVANVEFARWRMSALHATHTMLSSGRLTPLGTRFVSEMRDLLESWCAEPVPDSALSTAALLSNDHHKQWLADNVFHLNQNIRP